ncbi:MAG: hypothetical protein HFI63_04500 [Lachnospiraceae bacterium]|nr:hypothetical protein [Lachnospiraceae bacterium]
MNQPCEIIRDLLPLYIDNACSAPSVEMIENHLAECSACTELLQSMKSNQYETALHLEKEGVIAHQARRQKRKTLIAGAGIAGILCIPILVCLIVNLAVGHALDWFFIVLTSMMVLASLLVVPLIADRQRGLYTIFSFTGSLLLLLFTCAVYTGGDWFLLAGTAVLFGLSVLFTPYLAYTLPLPAFWKRNRGLFFFSVDSVLFVVMLLCIGFYCDSALYWKLMPPIVLFNAGFLWGLFLICRYLTTNRWIRAGIASVMTGGYIFIVDPVIARILGERRSLPGFHLNTWNLVTSDENIKWLILIGSIFAGLICVGIGIVRKRK